MSKEKVLFSETLLYPIVFMLLVSIVFVGILAAMYRGSEAKIEKYRTEQYQKLVLKLLATTISTVTGQNPEEIVKAYPESYNAYIRSAAQARIDRKVYSAVVGDSVLAYCAEIGGKGLWGSMRALVATNRDFDTILDLAIYEQMETPGLGARIGEEWFMKQFRGKKAIADGEAVSFELIPEKQPATADTQINQVTGATITSVSVLKMLRDELTYVHSKKQAQSE